MIRLLKVLALWLEARFPPKVMVTEERYSEQLLELTRLRDRICNQESKCNILEEKLFNAEESIRAIKDLLAKGGATILKSETQRLKDQFIRGEFNRGPDREALEAKS